MAPYTGSADLAAIFMTQTKVTLHTNEKTRVGWNARKSQWFGGGFYDTNEGDPTHQRENWGWLEHP